MSYLPHPHGHQQQRPLRLTPGLEPFYRLELALSDLERTSLSGDRSKHWRLVRRVEVTEYHDKATCRILFAGDGGNGKMMAILGKVQYSDDQDWRLEV